MNTNDQYAADHLIAKIAVYICYVMTGTISIELGAPYVGLLLGTGVWLFGVNSVAFVVETARGHEHRHNRV